MIFTTSRRPRSSIAGAPRRLLFGLAVAACCATRGRGFLRPAPSSCPAGSAGGTAYRWGAVNTRAGAGRTGVSNRLMWEQQQQHQQQYNSGVGGGAIRERRGRGVSMAATGGQLGPGKGTQVVLLRHGMSTFNKLNIFTGWCDVPLADEGKTEAFEAGKLLAAAGYRFDVAHASVLKRACTSLHRLLEGSGQPYIPIKTSWRLNERHYGALQGRNKATLEEAMGDVVVEWRRAYGTRPPPMTDTHPHWPLISLDSRYRGLKIPESESLRDTANRVMEYWESDIVPDIRDGKRVVVVAHANTLRSLVKRLDGIHEDAIRNINIPTGEPFVYEFDANLRTVGEPDEYGFRGRFVGDMMAEKDAAVDEYKRREQACMDKWEENPELVPEECICAEDMEDFPASAPLERFGEAQASLGLDRYSVGYDLPVSAFLSKDAETSGGGGGGSKDEKNEVEIGGLILETMADILGSPDEREMGGEQPLAGLGGEGKGGERERTPDRNETSPAPNPT